MTENLKYLKISSIDILILLFTGSRPKWGTEGLLFFIQDSVSLNDQTQTHERLQFVAKCV